MRDPQLVRGFDHREQVEHWHTLAEWRALIYDEINAGAMSHGPRGITLYDDRGLVYDIEASWDDIEAAR